MGKAKVTPKKKATTQKKKVVKKRAKKEEITAKDIAFVNEVLAITKKGQIFFLDPVKKAIYENLIANFEEKMNMFKMQVEDVVGHTATAKVMYTLTPKEIKKDEEKKE